MLKTRLLLNIFLAAILSVIVLLAYLYIFIHPAYSELLTENTEDEAVRFASFLVASQNINAPIDQITLPSEIEDEVGRLHGDELLIKLRIFSPQGEIVYSTLPKEIGTINKYPYFHEQVATGNIYSKTIQKNSMTAEMEIVSTDLVETYVPIMAGGEFLGAIETYYDITASTKKISALKQHSLALLGSLSLILLSLLYYALHYADLSIRAREKAEEKLRLANEELEMRVAERAGELLTANTNLSHEITERTQAQIALSEALTETHRDKEKISVILRSVNDGLLVMDSDDRIVLMNGAAETIIAVAQTDAIGRSLSEVINNDRLYTIFSTLLTDKITTTVDFESFDSAGQKRIYQARTSQLRNDDGGVHGIIILMQDVTQERQLEQMKTDFLAMAAHELSTPLTTIIGYAELLHSEEFPALTPEIQRESLEFIHNKANALSRIVDDLLDVSRAESGQKLSINKVSFDLNQSLESMVKDYKKRNSAHFILFNQPDTDGKIFADPTRFEQVLDNLLSNALKYTPAGGHIRISNRRDVDFHEIIITDDGIGMTSGQLEHIFDKFYRADASNTAKPGIGLGMSLTKHIVEGHRGTITVTSEPDQGTQVVIRLPHLLPKQ